MTDPRPSLGDETQSQRTEQQLRLRPTNRQESGDAR